MDNLLIPKLDKDEATKNLLNKGFIFTRNPDMYEMNDMWFVYSNHCRHLKKDELCAGPFPIHTKEYEHILENNLPKQAKIILLGFRKLEYDRTGQTGNEFKLRVDKQNNEIIILASILDSYDLNNPYVGKEYTWFFVKDSMRNKLLKNNTISKSMSRYGWWKTRIKLEQPLDSKDFTHQKEFFSVPHIEDIEHLLPFEITAIIMELSYRLNPSGKFLRAKKTEILWYIEQAKKKINSGNNNKDILYLPDREVLIKELLEFNNLTYPCTTNEVFDFLLKIEMLVSEKDDFEFLYGFNKKIPKVKFNKPNGWDEKASSFIEEGNILQNLIRSKYSNNVPSKAKTGRNDKCPCGSGLKYKKCCGK